MGKRTRITTAKDNPEPAGDQQMVETQQQRDQRAFAQGNRKQRRQIAKRNGFFKHQFRGAFKESSEMVRGGESNDNI